MFLIKFFYTIKRYFYQKFYSKPSRVLAWNVEDFEIGKKWAKSQPHPHYDKYDLWDYLKTRDSVEILHYINTRLRETNSIL